MKIWKAWSETRNYSWESYGNSETEALDVMRKLWKQHKRACTKAFGYWSGMSTSEFMEDVCTMELAKGNIKPCGFIDNQLEWESR